MNGNEAKWPHFPPIYWQVYIYVRSYFGENAFFVAHRALAEASRGITFLSEVADGQNFLMNLTGCRVLHFTWNGDGDQEKVGPANYMLGYLGGGVA